MRTFALLTVLVAACCGATQTPAPTPTPTPTPDPTPIPDPTPTPDPTPDPTNTTQCTEPRPSPDHVCMQDCGPPVVREGDPDPAWRWLTPDEVAARNRGGCPRCLPADAMIATPDGDVAVSNLTVGARVFTVDAEGRREVAVVLRMGSTPVRQAHTMLRVTLADGRVITASGEHPVAGGHTLVELGRGATLDGAAIVAIERVPFAGDRTWDLLPSGPTGLYIADGVVLGSTLRAR